MDRKITLASNQAALAFKTWGGRREGAGRPVGKGRRAAPHRKRIRVKSYQPQHTTLRLVGDIAKLRRWKIFAEIVVAIRAAQREGFLIAEFSVQDGHLHLITEANGWKALSDGTRALSIRIARALNRVLKRSGRVIADRYHARSLSTPREVKNALVYVLQNAKKHFAQRGIAISSDWLDRFSSAGSFRGWNAEARLAAELVRESWKTHAIAADDARREARTWLLHTGWKRHGLLRASDVPAG